MLGNFYTLATPIGNLEDISARALRVLSTVNLILCEDTRVSYKLLSHYNIKTPVKSFHQHSGLIKINKIIDLLKEGKDIALISDAGTPGISDPGAKLISMIKEDLGNEARILAIPGPCALISALSISGWPAEKFTFLGFLANKKGRQSQIKNLLNYPHLIVLYESKHRMIKLLKELLNLENTSKRKIEIMIARELTKKFEQSIFGRPEELIELLSNNPASLKGEFVLILKIEK
jgi:16S rRNA (cytidine1402-2'-O)-methyltransferase